MDIFRLSKCTLFTLLILKGIPAYSQITSVPIWKKLVAREIDMQTKENAKVQQLKSAPGDTTLLEMIVSNVNAGKVTAYSNIDHNFTTKLTAKQLNAMLVPTPDTLVVVDPASGKEITKVVFHELNYTILHKYRILEEWTFNTVTGNTEIHIAGVAPMKEVFGENGTFRGTQALFWVRYNEIAGILADYEKYHPDNSMVQHIWDDYFQLDSTKIKSTQLNKRVTREINIGLMYDGKKHHLRDLSNDTTLLEMMVGDINMGLIGAYPSPDSNFTNRLTPNGLNDLMVPPPDTIIVVDPVTTNEIIKVIRHDFNYDAVTKFRLLEDWTFNASTGNTDIHITGVAPVNELWIDGAFKGKQPIFWVRYPEMSGVLARFEQLHPENALALRIWRDYFWSDEKPAEKK